VTYSWFELSIVTSIKYFDKSFLAVGRFPGKPSELDQAPPRIMSTDNNPQPRPEFKEEHLQPFTGHDIC
jgi:hypothetical protein